MQIIVFATHNKDKLKEIQAIINDIPGMEEFNNDQGRILPPLQVVR